MVSKPNTKVFGILSVLVQAYYDAEYLFDVPAAAFNPPPKVVSGVIQLTRKK
ncbi:rRNA adenine N-6-methyltransferase family protein [Acinetobacter baumannii]